MESVDMNSLKNIMLKLHPATAPMSDQSQFGESSFGITDLIGYVMFLGALYLAIKCKGPGGNLRWDQIILAVIFSPFYVIYRLARPCV